MNEELCTHCGASLKKYWHRLTPGLVKTLAIIYSTVCSKSENKISKDELDLTHSEYGNLQKLRFHALIAKYKKDGVWRRGDWLITKRGADFLKGYCEIPYRVQTFRNKVVAHDAKKVGISDVMKSDKYFEGYDDFRNQLEFMVFPEAEVVETPVVQTYRKRGKKKICSCGGEVKSRFISEGINPDTGNMRGTTKLMCNKCSYDFGEAT